MSFKFLFIFFAFAQILWCDSFHLVTYNILNDQYLWEGLYDHASPEILSWETRRKKIVARILKLNPDVICLQELNRPSFEYIQEQLPEFEGCYAKKGNDSDDGVGTFCKKGTFDSVSHRAALCDGTSKCGKLPIQPALFTKLSLKNGKSITLVNTKIKWCKDVKPYDPVWNHVQYLLKSISSTRSIVVGDFNMRPDNPLLQDFFSVGFQDGFFGQNTYSNYANHEFQRVDYILSTQDIKTVPLEIASLDCAKPLPNEAEPSDHLPVGSLITDE